MFMVMLPFLQDNGVGVDGFIDFAILYDAEGVRRCLAPILRVKCITSQKVHDNVVERNHLGKLSRL